MFAISPSGMFEGWFCQRRGGVLVVAIGVRLGLLG